MVLNPAHGDVYSIQHCMKKFVSDLRQVGSFVQVLRFPPPIKLTSTDNVRLQRNKNHTNTKQ
jgi:hypothetical protein